MLSLDLTSVRPKVSSKVSFEWVTEALPFLPSPWSMGSPLVVSGFFVPEQREMTMQGTIRGTLNTVCSRCLAPMSYPLDLPFRERLLYRQDIPYVQKESESLGDLEERYWIYDKLEYDFEPMIVDEILREVPIQPLCRPDCKGLCDHCGINLNHDICHCGEDEIDPRWAALAQLQDGEV